MMATLPNLEARAHKLGLKICRWPDSPPDRGYYIGLKDDWPAISGGSAGSLRDIASQLEDIEQGRIEIEEAA